MGFVEDNITDGENIVYRAKLHRIIFMLPGVFFVLFIFSILASFLNPTPPTGVAMGHGNMPASVHTLVQFAPMLLILTITGIIPLINYRTSEFAVTNKRVFAKYGFIRRRSTEILLTKIEGVVVDQSILGRTLGYGTVIISGTGSLKNNFKKISNPLEFRKRVQDQISSQN